MSLKLKPIGSGSDAENYGYTFSLLISWLSDIRDHELEVAEGKPRYQKRAYKLSDLVDELESMDTPATPEKAKA